ncbi:MAG TPA: PEP-CTERM sorting domain-containing protein [Tepidisphaeraceae bacterium]|jgi:hypothetical protein
MRYSRTNWRRKFRRRAAACAIGGGAALVSAASYAQTAFDNASDPVYNDGWQAGDNGGFGFTPWNFDAGYVFQGTLFPYAHPGFKAIDDGLHNGTQYSNPFNNIGRAWDIGATPSDDGSNHVGRGFPALQIGQTLKVVFDNPTKRQFFKGYFIRLNGGSGGVNGNIVNLGYSASFPTGTAVNKMQLTRFEYFSYGQWQVNDAATANTGVFDTDTAAAGSLFQVTRTGPNTYDLLLDSFGSSADFSASRTFQNPSASVDWIEFVFFNTVSDTGSPPTTATDLYIRSMEIVPEPGTAALLLLAALGAAVRSRQRRRGTG